MTPQRRASSRSHEEPQTLLWNTAQFTAEAKHLLLYMSPVREQPVARQSKNNPVLTAAWFFKLWAGGDLEKEKKQKNNALQVRTVTRGKYNTGQSPVDIHQFSELEVCYHFSLFMKCLQWETIQIWWRELEQVRKLI